MKSGSLARGSSASPYFLDSSRTLIVGRKGRLARALRYLFPQAQSVGRESLNIADEASVRHTVELVQPRLIVNCAAITDLLLCERDPIGTRRVNVDGVAYLAAAARAVDAMLIHMSSDYAANPVNEYGKGKRDSESYGDVTIRAKIYDGSHWAWQALRNGHRIEMTTHEVANPISTTGLASLLPSLLQKNLRGIVCLGSKERLSLFEIGQVWADVLGASRDLVIPAGLITSSYQRSADCFMPVQALAESGIAVPSLGDDAASHRGQYAQYAGHE